MQPLIFCSNSLKSHALRRVRAPLIPTVPDRVTYTNRHLAAFLDAKSFRSVPVHHRSFSKSAQYCKIAGARSYTTEVGKKPTADDYVQELQDLYEIAKNELEIATESTDASTIYAASDRETLREAFDDLDNAYKAYAGGQLPQSNPKKKGTMEGGIDNEDGKGNRATTPDTKNVPSEVREEIKRRVGQRIREMRNAVEALEKRSFTE